MQRYTLTGRERPTVALGGVQDRQAGGAESAPSPINWQGQRYSTHQW
jgi:hypothetical protein